LDGYDSSRFFRREGTVRGSTVGPGWVTIAKNLSGRFAGEILFTDADSGDHAFIRIHWLRSYADSNFTVINCGGHGNRITGIRVLYQTSDDTYGTKYLQVYVTVSSSYDVNIFRMGDDAHFNNHTVVTPVVQNSISGYLLHGSQLTGLELFGFATDEGISAGGGYWAGNTQVINSLGVWVGPNTGLKGEKGQKGVTGTQGSTGQKGINGLSIQGTTGTQGKTGSGGAQGSTGSGGAQGSSGSNGISVKGQKGERGSGGAQGSTGSGGAQGSTGSGGAQGSSGSNGSSVKGQKGERGSGGAQGSSGSNGSSVKGQKGERGSGGAQGSTGSGGAQGSSGSQGSSGTGTKGQKGESGSSNNWFYSLAVGSGVSSHSTNGEIRAQNNVIAYYSDARLKNFHGRIDNPLYKVEKLNGYYFTENEVAKSLGYNNDEMQVGVSAQEVEAVMPEVIKDAPIDSKYKTVQYEKLVPLLIESIKELSSQVKTLQKENAEIKAIIKK